MQAAGAFLGPGAVGLAAMKELTKDKTAGGRAVSARFLGSGTDSGDRVILEKALSGKNWVVRAAAAEAFGSRRRPRRHH